MGIIFSLSGIFEEDPFLSKEGRTVFSVGDDGMWLMLHMSRKKQTAETKQNQTLIF